MDKTCQGAQASHSMSDKTAEQIDSAIKSIVDTIYIQTIDLLEKNREVVDYCAKELLKKETLTEHQLLEMTKNMHRL